MLGAIQSKAHSDCCGDDSRYRAAAKVATTARQSIANVRVYFQTLANMAVTMPAAETSGTALTALL